MANQYNISNIFEYEDKTRHYCISEGGVELTTQMLMELATKEDKFDSNYAEYLIFKRLHLISDYITQKAKNKGFIINVKDNEKIKEDLANNNCNEPKYEEWIEFYERESFSDFPDIYEIINQAIMEKNWNVLYYLYYKEENELINLVAKEKNKLNERKFFIIQ